MQKQSYTGPERRRFPRKETELKIEYALQDELETKKIDKVRVTHSANIGGGGLCMCMNEDIDFNAGTQLYMILNLPPDQRKFFFIVQVIYIRPADEEGYRYKVGLRYLDMTDEDRISLMNFLDFNAELPPDIIEKIRKKAYDFWVKRDYQHGNDWLDWFEAKRRILKFEDNK